MRTRGPAIAGGTACSHSRPAAQPVEYRLAGQTEPPPLPHWSQQHWLDRLERGVRVHISAMQQQRDELAQQARPPPRYLPGLFEVMVDDEEAIRLGAAYNQAFAAALNRK